jgi:hypothetical protein
MLSNITKMPNPDCGKFCKTNDLVLLLTEWSGKTRRTTVDQKRFKKTYHPNTTCVAYLNSDSNKPSVKI